VATDTRLDNEQFVARAPAEIVTKEREKAGALREQVTKLREKLEALEGAGS
jgi:valyl-tRNA synthetase